MICEFVKWDWGIWIYVFLEVEILNDCDKYVGIVVLKIDVDVVKGFFWKFFVF